MSDMHVDIVKNEWLAGVQVAVARVEADGSDISVAAIEPKWEEIVRRPIRDGVTGETLYSQKDPTHFVEALHTAISSSYLFATLPHGLGECPFSAGPVLRLEDADGSWIAG